MPTALTPVAVQLRTVGVKRAIPRTIHGVRLAITSTARSERRIAVRGSEDVGVTGTCSASRHILGTAAQLLPYPTVPRNTAGYQHCVFVIML